MIARTAWGVAYGAVIAWAYAGIAVKQAELDLVPAFTIAGTVYVPR
jgi:hypothetical protein